MNIFKKIIIGFVFYTFPLAIAGFLIIGLYEKSLVSDITPIAPVYFCNLIFSVLWTFATFLLTIAMFFFKGLRNDVLVKLTGIKERDEREIQIVGKGLKSTYLSTMTILLFLLILSLFNIRFESKNADNAGPDQRRGTGSITMEFSIIDHNALITHKEGYDKYFELNDLPISSTTLIIVLILWQVFSYRYVTRRALKIDN